MKAWSMAAALALLVGGLGCEKKAAEGEAAVEETTEEEGAEERPQHIDTNREAFKAAGKAARDIEVKGEERNASADEAMKAGE